ncbi:ABC-F family ATP-binding cassette domain-containing protein [Siphonobacter sp. SORGH_AS_0500]|uniref:ABC-F family ATP-binding cassette domain-containing protein n=1 Tax=Siphonobacter sp. SORGH_AS_0500 TaxID=1864824 RepID=UPI00285F6696|nr:ABC-F family ATP-binding cassette domain-containing protein [Siphonobacter sp. SORGH_AS_0500]MDR6194122.1 ATP-binding cassette subfamily F protein uup [Siphonobacter sp. SORGH_AS_0500]
MNYLSAENLSKSTGERWLFKNITFGLSKGDKVALVGRNGTGKTSLMDVLAGLQTAEEGVISIRKEVRLGYLSQNPALDENQTVLDILFLGDSPLLQAIRSYEKALIDGNDQEISDAAEEMEAQKAWDYESKVKQVLGRLGVAEENFTKLIGQLSGGQRKRVALAKVLLEEPDLLILDEPTNHLDLEAIEWLENYLGTANTTLLLVTHDRYFLDRVCNEILELADGSIYRYKGNYSYFLERQSERYASEASSVDKAQNLLRKELEWMRRQPKARGTKAQYRIDAFYDLQDKANQGRKESNVELNIGMARLGSKIIELDHIKKAFGPLKIVEDFQYIFRRRERIGIVGKNGVGKSTFLDILTGEQQADSGEISVGETVRFGYYTQSEPTFLPGQRVIDVVKDIAEVVTLGSGETITASQFLQHFLFEPKRQYTDVEKLSGGEKRRLQLLQVLIKNPNFLILDEPTNDLDIQTLNVLEDYLLQFSGCLVLVSHDRYFMDRLVEHLFVFEGQGKIRDFPGNYTDYRESLSNAAPVEASKPKSEAPKAEPAPAAVTPAPAKRKLSFKEQKELESLDKEIPELENKRAVLTEQMNSGSADYQQIALWAKEIEEINALLEDKEFRWMELSE